MGYNNKFVAGVPLNAVYTSPPQQINDSSGYAVQLVFGGSTCSFSAKLQVSTDPLFLPPGANYSQLNTPVNFDDLANSSQTFTTSGTFTYNVNPAEYVWVRLVITDNSSGANNGTIAATINVKGPNV